MPKIMIDPVYTQEVGRCASAVKMKICVQYLLERTSDVYFYWLIPNTIGQEELEWLPKDDRIMYYRIPYFEDRYKEFWHASEEWRRLISFAGKCWDIDILMTNRTSLVPFAKWAMHRPSGVIKGSKFVFLVEDMPIMSFKMFIPTSTPREADLSTIMGYLQAKETCISAYWEKAHILETAKMYYSASSVRYLKEHIHESVSNLFDRTHLKSAESIQRMLDGKRKFTISYAGRMVNRDFVDDSFDVLLNHWVLGKDDVRIIVCTVSKNFGKVDHQANKVIEFLRPNREEFWRIMREESDVGVFMSRDEDYSMSMMEPLVQGTPLVIYRAEHSVASVGEHYPFFVKSPTEGFALVKEFRNNYLKMYMKFAEWSKTHFTKILTERNNDWIPLRLAQTLADWRVFLGEEQESLKNNEIVRLIEEHSPKNKPFDMLEVMQQLEKKKIIRGALTAKDESQFDNKRLVYSTHYDTFRLGLLKRGFNDAGVLPGTLRHPA